MQSQYFTYSHLKHSFVLWISHQFQSYLVFLLPPHHPSNPPLVLPLLFHSPGFLLLRSQNAAHPKWGKPYRKKGWEQHQSIFLKKFILFSSMKRGKRRTGDGQGITVFASRQAQARKSFPEILFCPIPPKQERKKYLDFVQRRH